MSDTPTPEDTLTEFMGGVDDSPRSIELFHFGIKLITSAIESLQTENERLTRQLMDSCDEELS